ncbi:YchJ family protein [Trinickia acidisoli]|uniref:YchJ family protein n=1 Tax=Trinickia acidisoli TaxID=2767482 RepID=UPI001A8C6891|nr:YchJ family protein [Trinickia acidisoli]
MTAAGTRRSAPLECPCGGAAPGRPANARPPRFDACCGPYLDGRAVAPTALELMRSRYTAYVLGHTDYLRATWDAATCPANLDVEANALDAADAPRWLGLQVRRFEAQDARHAIVEFVARYKQGGRGHRLHEVSRFVRGEDERWRYVDGDVSER